MRKDDGYSFEEKDDVRTQTGELTQDIEKSFKLPVLEYLGEFKALIDACGQVSYFYNMKKFVGADVNKAKNIASAYHHDLRYYVDQLNEWVTKARRSYSILKFHAEKFGYDMPTGKKEIDDFLNNLVVSIDRRDAYKDYLGTCFKKKQTLSLDEMERKFQKRLEKRRNKELKK